VLYQALDDSPKQIFHGWSKAQLIRVQGSIVLFMSLKLIESMIDQLLATDRRGERRESSDESKVEQGGHL
jgi:hypothetical protein